MNQFKRMLARANLQDVSYMLQTGSVQNELDEKNLEEREDEAVRILEQRLKKCVSDSSYNEVFDTALEYANDCCEIYFTVGMKAGAKLQLQLLNNNLEDY